MSAITKTLDHTVNQFRGVVITPDQLPADPNEFAVRLAHSLQAWSDADLRLVWLEIPIEKARLIPVATEAGFTFHHTGDDSLTLTYRLHPDALIPTYATHFIGAGGVVINARQELLVVSERHRRDLSIYP